MGSRPLLALLCCLSLSVLGQDEQQRGRDKYAVLKEEWCGSQNCYEVLEVSPSAEFRDIKLRYNNLSLTLHPDKNPDQSDADKARYVLINKAYEILSSKRRDYDDYLRIRRSMDSPVESPIVVLLALYLLIGYVVLYYQRQQQKECKKAILSHANVIRYYWETKNIDLTGKKKRAKKDKRRKGKKKRDKDGKDGDERTLCEIKEDIDHDEINEVIHKLNLLIPEWRDPEPTYQQALMDVLTSSLWLAQEVAFRVRWLVKYQVLQMTYSDEDREILCRRHHKLDETEWMTMPDEDRERLLNKRGPWKVKNKAL